jgi:hypothetical protein
MAPLDVHQHFREKQQPGTGLFGKCVLCLLLNAIFVLALFLAFLIGHFAAEAHLPSNKVIFEWIAHIKIYKKHCFIYFIAYSLTK